jgi:catechol 2,3-dioxygenase-like lactoylglutathione lyase family enzyme
MDLGAFSVSLSVSDMAASREFYAKLGFSVVGGNGESWAILSNGTAVIGLFHGMFEGNILTFNPGWEGLADPVDDFADIRELKAELSAAGLETEADTTGENPSGPASFMVTDPDGNVVLLDQHV